jgi:hypothetical protein
VVFFVAGRPAAIDAFTPTDVRQRVPRRGWGEAATAGTERGRRTFSQGRGGEYHGLSALMSMDIDQTHDYATTFSLELLRASTILCGLAGDLVDAIGPEDYPGERPEAVVLEMIMGTISSALATTGADAIAQATQLIVDARERVIEHLELALELSRRGRGAMG